MSSPQSAFAWRMPADWWLRNSRYFRYMVRELTAVFAALWVVTLLLQIPQMAGAPEGHSLWLATIRSPGWIAFSFTSFAFLLYHTATWFMSMGTVIYLRPGKTAIPASSIVAAMVVLWVVVSLVVAFILVTPGIGG